MAKPKIFSHDVYSMFYSTVICFILKTQFKMCEAKFKGTENQVFVNTTPTSTEQNICNTTMLFTEADQTEENASIAAKEQDQLQRFYSNLIFAQDMYIIPVVCPIGIVGNGLVANNLFSKRKTNSSFTYMCFILIADMLSLVSDLFLPAARILESSATIPSLEMAFYLRYWNADVLGILFRRFSLNVFCVLSFERLTAIRRPLKLYRSITVTRPYFFIIFSFIISIVATLYTPLFLKMEKINDKTTNITKYIHGYTDLYKSNEEYFAVFVTVTRFFDGPIQIVFFTVINGLIVYGLYQNKKSLASSSSNNRNQNISKLQTRLFKIFLMLSFTNMFAFLPTPVIVIVGKLFPETGLTIKSTKMKIIMNGGNFIRVMNSLTDFIVFLVISKDIRQDIYTKLTCRKYDKNRDGIDKCTTNSTAHTIS